jgi:hypothetical protein
MTGREQPEHQQCGDKGREKQDPMQKPERKHSRKMEESASKKTSAKTPKMCAVRIHSQVTA